ncbi:hypothetical protein [Streptomyces sp. 2A115]|uniref:phosphotriesterase family protein n=1 Tax=Streptomyces sp. 2A115 TaxID=3457439 RepID=UPI003FD10F0F
MVAIKTVPGPVKADALGVTLMHGHVFIRGEEIERNSPEPWGRQARVDDAFARLTSLEAVGVDPIVDPTDLGPGRDIRRVIAINEQGTSRTTPRASSSAATKR